MIQTYTEVYYIVRIWTQEQDKERSRSDYKYTYHFIGFIVDALLCIKYLM